MAKIAFLFPGQGSQSVGMGKDFYEQAARAREVFETFNRIVDPNLSQVCFEGPEEELRRTLYTQPAILATSLAALEVFQEAWPDAPLLAAGHSLGEYGALYASDVIDMETAARLVQKRSQLMEEAPKGAMSAVLGLDAAVVEQVMLQLQQQNLGPITVANYNTAEQSVISGSPEAVEAAAPLLKEAGAKRVLPLPVGGAFHSPLMDTAAGEFARFVNNYKFNDPAFPVITNVDAQPTLSGRECQEKLADQINHSVRWAHTMKRMVEESGVDTVIEIGPGKVLTGMFKKSWPDVKVYNIFDMASLEATVTELQALKTGV